MAQAPRDNNFIPAVLLESSTNPGTVLTAKGDELTGRLLVDMGGGGTVTSVSVVTANGISGSVATATTTPAITLTLGAITPSSINVSGDITFAVGATRNISVANAATNTAGNILNISAGNANGAFMGGDISVAAGYGGVGGVGGFAYLTAGDGNGAGVGGDVVITAGDTTGNIASGGNIYLVPGTNGNDSSFGTVFIRNAVNGLTADLDTSLLASSDKTFTFPNDSGTFLLTNGNGSALTGLTDTQISLGQLGVPTYKTLNDRQNTECSSGVISGFTITPHAGPDGTVDIASGKGRIKATNTLTGVIKYFDFAGVNSLALTDNNVNYIYVDYNAGTPQILATTDRTTIHFYDQFIIGRAFRDGTEVDIVNDPVSIYNVVRRNYERTVTLYGFQWASGATTSESSTRKIAVTAGKWYIDDLPISSPAFDTNGTDTLEALYYNGTSWVESAQTTISNTQYNDVASGLVAISANKYINAWIYICEGGSELLWVYGQAQYNTLTEAQNTQAPSLVPNHISQFAKLIARITLKQGVANFVAISNALINTLPPGVATSHSSLTNLAWTSSGHTGTASTIAAFDGSGSATNLTTTGSGTVAVLSTAPTISGGSITGLTNFAIRDTSAAFDVTVAATSSSALTAGRTLTIDTNNVSSTLKMGANLTVSGASTINQNVSTTGTPSFDQATITGSYLKIYHGGAAIFQFTGVDTANNYPIVDLRKARGTVGSESTVVSGDFATEIYFTGHDGSSFVQSAVIRGEINGTVGTNQMPVDIVFLTTTTNYTGWTERLRIDASAGTIVSTTIYNTTVGVTNRDVYVDSTGVIGYVSSSLRYKENIKPLDSSMIYNLNPVSFTYKSDETHSEQYGLIAEEVNEVLPEIVNYDKEGLPETIGYSKLIPLLINEIKGLNDRIKILETK